QSKPLGLDNPNTKVSIKTQINKSLTTNLMHTEAQNVAVMNGSDLLDLLLTERTEISRDTHSPSPTFLYRICLNVDSPITSYVVGL
ncbi:hypothetical protein ACLOJK_007467, partial [Asimina triloba]